MEYHKSSEDPNNHIHRNVYIIDDLPSKKRTWDSFATAQSSPGEASRTTSESERCKDDSHDAGSDARPRSLSVSEYHHSGLESYPASPLLPKKGAFSRPVSSRLTTQMAAAATTRNEEPRLSNPNGQGSSEQGPDGVTPDGPVGVEGESAQAPSLPSLPRRVPTRNTADEHYFRGLNQQFHRKLGELLNDCGKCANVHCGKPLGDGARQVDGTQGATFCTIACVPKRASRRVSNITVTEPEHQE